MFAKNFEDLRVWQESRILVREVYVAFNGCKDYSFCEQIQRATISIMNNIAEGFYRKTKKDFAHFLDLAKASSGEAKSMLYAAEDLAYLSPQRAEILGERFAGLCISIGSLASKLRKQVSEK